MSDPSQAPTAASPAQQAASVAQPPTLPQNRSVPEQCQRFLGFDWGSARLGAAFGSRMMGEAQPLKSIAATGDVRWAAIAKLIAQWEPDAFVVGVPLHPDGKAHQNTASARKFGRQLHGRFELPVFEVDERYSSVEAARERPRDLDAASACVILNQFFAELVPTSTATPTATPTANLPDPPASGV
jgi:putative holliday junction resolvase